MKKLKILGRNFGFWLSRKINFPLVVPDTLQLSLTNLCNLRCKMCHVWANAGSKDELSFDEIKKIIDQAVAWGIAEINLCGGEPLLSPVCFPVIQYAKEKQMKVILTSNGTMIDAPAAKKIVDMGVDILCVSLDGATAATHDAIRGLSGAYEKIIKGIRTIDEYKKDGVPLKVLIMTLHNDNLDEAVDFVRLAKKLGTDSLYITSLVLNNVKLFEHSARSPLWIKGDRLKKLDETVDELASLSKDFYGFDYPSFNLIKKYFRGELKDNDWVCFAGFRRLVVCPDGNIMMCGEIIGHVREVGDIRKIWNSQKASAKRKKIKQCRQFCLQDCHARQESSSFKSVLMSMFKKI